MVRLFGSSSLQPSTTSDGSIEVGCLACRIRAARRLGLYHQGHTLPGGRTVAATVSVKDLQAASNQRRRELGQHRSDLPADASVESPGSWRSGRYPLLWRW